MSTTRSALALTVLVTAAIATSAAPAQAAQPGLYGVHEHGVGHGTALPAAAGGVRLWDAGTTWRDIQPAPGVWRWETLDRAVAAAGDREVILVLGQTPAWATAVPDAPAGIYGVGAASRPTEAAWTEYVRAVAARDRGRIDAYETWNEADLAIFSAMSPAEMARLQSLAYRTIKAEDPSALVGSPSVVLRTDRALPWALGFAAAKGYRWADVVTVHAYPEAHRGPERAVRLAKRLRRALEAVGVRLPVWDTELNFTRALSVREQRAFMARSLVLHEAAGIGRLYWYGAPFLGVDVQGGSPALAAMREVRRWLRGGVESCRVTDAGRYRCVVRRGVVRWDPASDRMPRLHTPKGPRR
jgi:hypothetical protein